ncbi:HlyD family type I secretion periplasmic adaptor subunit [Vandammella animalimorsus]|uniref:HlyD family type I secretion periplasmic adaptor subunit n=1 Tax=Vandammella animalimorsus TaxID=2029117 RepID=UPI0031BAF588
MSLRHYLGAWAALWGRYGRVLAFHWRHRRQRPAGLLHEDEAEFLPAALAVQERPVSPTLRLIAWLLMLLALAVLLWSLLGRMDIIVQAEGKVVLSERTKTVAAVETGRVAQLRVREGQSVRAGDLLLQLDTRLVEAEQGKAHNELNQAALVQARNQALLQALELGRRPRLPALQAINAAHGARVAQAEHAEAARHVLAQYEDVAARLRLLDDELRIQRQALPLASSQAERYRKLAQTRDVSQDAWQERQQAALAIQARLNDARNQRQVLLAQTRRQAMDEIAQARRVIDAARQDIERSAASSALLHITAPVDGTVQQLAIHTLGGVVPAAQPIMQIVPQQGPLEVEAFVENKDVGFIAVGQPVALKVQAFEYTKYGTLPGRVQHISRDAIADEQRGLLYAVRIAMEQQSLPVQGRQAPIVPGMAITAEIKTGERRVIEYVLSPLMQHAHEALDER